MLTQQEYEAKREVRYNRLLAAAERAEHESEAARNESNRIASFITHITISMAAASRAN